jgi:hypothetical protein
VPASRAASVPRWASHPAATPTTSARVSSRRCATLSRTPSPSALSSKATSEASSPSAQVWARSCGGRHAVTTPPAWWPWSWAKRALSGGGSSVISAWRKASVTRPPTSGSSAPPASQVARSVGSTRCAQARSRGPVRRRSSRTAPGPVRRASGPSSGACGGIRSIGEPPPRPSGPRRHDARRGRPPRAAYRTPARAAPSGTAERLRTTIGSAPEARRRGRRRPRRGCAAAGA